MPFEAIDLDQNRKSPKEIFLTSWDECVGIYRGLRLSKRGIAIVLSLVNGQTLEIFFHKASIEEENVLREFHDHMIGRKIGVMKVDDRENPILIRTLSPEREKSSKVPPMLPGRKRHLQARR